METVSKAWERELDPLHERLGSLFRRPEPRQRALAYLKGPLARSNARTAGNSLSGSAKLRPTACNTCLSERSGMPMLRATCCGNTFLTTGRA